MQFSAVELLLPIAVLLSFLTERMKSFRLVKVLFIISSVLFVWVFSAHTYQAAVGISLAITLALTMTKDESILIATSLILCVSVGNWLEPALPEFLLLMFLTSLNIRSNVGHHVSTAQIMLWCLAVVAYFLNLSIGNETTLPLLVTISLLLFVVYSDLWISFRKVTPAIILSIGIKILFARFLIDKLSFDLTTTSYSVVNSIHALAIITSIMSIYARLHSKQLTAHESAALVLLVMLGLPILPDNLLYSQTFLMLTLPWCLLMSVMILLMQKQQTSFDNGLAYSIVFIALLPFFVEYSFHQFAMLTNLVLIIVASFALYFSTQIQSKDIHSDILISIRARIPQLAVIIGFIGCNAVLWYILDYVRKVQS